jgi:ribosomal 50S subunit-recycling heat shock protein
MAEPRLSIGKINIIKLWVNGILIPTEIAWTNLPSSKNVNVNDITEIKVPSKNITIVVMKSGFKRNRFRKYAESGIIMPTTKIYPVFNH